MSFIWRVNKCAHLVTQTVLSPIFGLINYPLLEETKHGEFKVLFRCLIRVRVFLNVIVVAARHLQVHWILHVLQWNGSRQRTEVVVRHRSLPVATETRVPVKGASSWKYIGTTWGDEMSNAIDPSEIIRLLIEFSFRATQRVPH